MELLREAMLEGSSTLADPQRLRYSDPVGPDYVTRSGTTTVILRLHGH
jgi:hypothetical protein